MCPECKTRGYLVWPSYGNCQTCLRVRLENLGKAFARLELKTPNQELLTETPNAIQTNTGTDCSRSLPNIPNAKMGWPE